MTEPDSTELRIETPAGQVSALLQQADPADAMLLLAHGAGAGMRHPFMTALAERLVSRGITCLRYQFPYTEAGRRRPDHASKLIATVRAAATEAATLKGELPLFAGGKSMGGRMTSLAHAGEPLDGVRGLVFFGFPLHRPGVASTARAEHLGGVQVPTLFLQGDRDRLAELPLIQGVCKELGKSATLHPIVGADHGFHVLQRSGRTDDEVLDELVELTRSWMRSRALE